MCGDIVSPSKKCCVLSVSGGELRGGGFTTCVYYGDNYIVHVCVVGLMPLSVWSKVCENGTQQTLAVKLLRRCGCFAVAGPGAAQQNDSGSSSRV